MGAEDNKRLTRRALDEIYTRGDLELVDEIVHPGLLGQLGLLPSGEEAEGRTAR